jgi:ubiquinone/menaquinone biosynthesis C-methylase UbiE
MRNDDKKSADHFDKDSEIYASMYLNNSPSGHSFRARRSKCHKMLGTGPLGRLLDVGGASGVYFQELKDQTESYDIIDISPLMIKAASRIESPDIPLTCKVASIYELPYPDNHFDTVIAMGVLEYIDEPWTALKEVARVSKLNTPIIVSFPNAHSPMRRMSRAIYGIFNKKAPFASREFKLNEVKQGAKKARLITETISGYNAQLWPFPLTWRFSKIAFVTAVALEPFLDRMGSLWGTSFTAQFKKKNKNSEDHYIQSKN